MNSNFVINQAKRIADRATKFARGDETQAVKRCFQLLLGREPDAQELEACLVVAKQDGLLLVCRALINSNEFAFLP